MALRKAYQEAAEHAGGMEVRKFRIGGHIVWVCFAGKALEPYLGSAFAHLVSDSRDHPDLKIFAWDSRTTRVPLPDEIGELDQYHAGGMPNADAEDGIFSAYQRPDSGLTLFAPEYGEGIYWLPGDSAPRVDDRSSPFRAILSWWMRDVQKQVIHAAAVGWGPAGALLAAPAHSGKSTTALACLTAGLRYVGDDYCLLSMTRGPVAHSLYSSAKLDGDNVARFPGLQPLLANPGTLDVEKAVFFLAGGFRTQMAERLSISALLVPQIANLAAPELEPISAAAALAALAPSSLLQLSAARPEALRMMAQLVRSVPAFQLRLPGDVSLVPPVIRRLLERLERGGSE